MESQDRVDEYFSKFYEKWISQLEQLLKLLLMVSREASPEISCEAAVEKLTVHHREYFSTKWAATAARDDNVLSFFVPLWLTPLENAYLWITGWKPSTVFRLIDSLRNSQPPEGSVAGMTEEQVAQIATLRAQIKAEEERVEREMERLQVAVADRKMVELVCGMDSAAPEGMVDAAVKGLLAGLEKVMKMADCVRLKALKGVLDLLTPMQSVDFLAATSMLLIHLRKWGKKRSTRHHHHTTTTTTSFSGDTNNAPQWRS
ncbi:protein DOG1-like 4 [Andrographis paniculata]|uniref:protein DOG1-like 4 n=1 Tax=Andrographis paniculata TaxID=175694 RepID=UPI0021E75B22|nr:protein DOG1-like 4 [Andrographis paniculata]